MHLLTLINLVTVHRRKGRSRRPEYCNCRIKILGMLTVPCNSANRGTVGYELLLCWDRTVTGCCAV